MAAKRGKKAAKKINVRIGKRHRRRSKVSGSKHAAPRRRRRKSGGGFLGATGKGTTVKQIVYMAVGVAAGAAASHLILRPIEAKLAARWPMVSKFLAAGEVLLGGFVAINGKNKFINALGVGILAGGVEGLLQQTGVLKNFPRIAGDDMSEIHVPISGSLDNMLAGILADDRRDVYTATVAGLDRTRIVAETQQTEVNGIWDDVYDSSVKM